jgi:glycosyltransferase involved in cell wall biosynthesis
MIIVINTGFKHSRNKSSSSIFFKETLKRIAALNAEHHFVLLYEKEAKEVILSGENIMPVVTRAAGKYPLLWKYWYAIKLPAILKKYKADLFVSFNGICSLKANVPQCLLVNDLSFLHYPEQYKKSALRFYKRNTPLFLKKAEAIITLSDFVKQDIIRQYKISETKINAVNSGVGEEYKPLDAETRTAMKKKYTEDKEYFVFKGDSVPGSNVINLLKAFSLFKKRQKTNMKLVLTGEIVKDRSIIKNLSSYKYRNDVVVTYTIDTNELAKITGAAYGLVHPFLGDGFSSSILETMRCDVPVIASTENSMKGIAGEAMLYADVNKPADMADKMMLLFKDEKLRRELINKAKTMTREYSWDKTAALVWDSMQKAAE